MTQIGAIYVINAPVEETQSDKKFCYIISGQGLLVQRGLSWKVLKIGELSNTHLIPSSSGILRAINCVLRGVIPTEVLHNPNS